jgi:hypothetical protein
MIEASSDDREGETGGSAGLKFRKARLAREPWMSETREAASALAGRMEPFS